MYQDGYSALIWATLHDRATMVALLLDRGACIDNADKVKSQSDNGCVVRCIIVRMEGKDVRQMLTDG